MNIETDPGSPALFVLPLFSAFPEYFDLLAKLAPSSFEPCEVTNFRQVLTKMESDIPELDLE